MEAVAKLRNHEIAPRKMGLLCSLIRGKDVYSALNILRFQRKAGSLALEKLLRSAISNWSNKYNIDLDEANLFVKEVYATPGRTLKRFRPAPQGRAYRIRKRSNHVTLVVASRLESVSNPSQEVVKEEPKA
ncbi:MAG: 50S ribosomal protein L22 [Cytophagales bacterium]|nr:50S ribosomal protein L22 [Cytophagales bacterium]MDW8384361.1 50S ribosomal protein L22 [Flammeovirgaceae bacterium]